MFWGSEGERKTCSKTLKFPGASTTGHLPTWFVRKTLKNNPKKTNQLDSRLRVSSLKEFDWWFTFMQHNYACKRAGCLPRRCTWAEQLSRSHTDRCKCDLAVNFLNGKKTETNCHCMSLFIHLFIYLLYLAWIACFGDDRQNREKVASRWDKLARASWSQNVFPCSNQPRMQQQKVSLF